MSDDICGHTKNDGEKCTFSPKHSDGKCGHHTDTDESKPQGAPSKLKENTEVIDLIGNEIERGATISEALSEVEQKTGVYIARGTHDGWMAKGKREGTADVYAKYRSEVKRARNIAARSDRRNLVNKCRETDDTRTWWKVHQQQYGDLYAGDTEETEESEPIFAVPEELADEWQQQVTPSQ